MLKMRMLLIGLVLGTATQAVFADTITRFRTELSEDYVILGGIQGTGSAAGGFAEFVLTQPDGNPDATTLSYSIQFENVDLDGAQTPSVLDDITALHLHDITKCAPAFPQCIEGTDTAGTLHLLNIFGAPRNDDDDVMVDPAASTITGLWDDGDASMPGTPVPTVPISDPAVIDLLINGNVALFVHTNEVPAAASGGALTIVPEPQGVILLISAIGALLGWRRRRS
ncbi:MAG: PEP-CTERM sorting domain-containing protein [Planctomycetota bacterium]